MNFLYLGMKICGGQNDDGTYTGIFVKKILLGGAVALEGWYFCNSTAVKMICFACLVGHLDALILLNEAVN